MGYQPKYDRDARKSNGSPLAAKKKPSLGFILLGIVVVPLSVAVTCWLMGQMLCNVGRPKIAQPRQISDMAIAEQFHAMVGDPLQAVLEGMTASGGGAVTPEEPPVRKVYWIEEGAQVAPEPDQSCYGQTTDPAELEKVIEEAAYLLDGQELYFSPDVELFEGSAVNYYLDESIFAVTWKEGRDDAVYTFSEVKISHPSQFRRHLAGGEFGSEMQYHTTEMAQSVNAVVASSGDFYRFRKFGIMVYEGQVRRVNGTYAETCYIDSNGDMHFTYAGELVDGESAQAYVDENDIQFSLAFGPILVDNYQLVEHEWYGVGEILDEYARAALCQMDELHYIVVTANGEGTHYKVPDVATFAEHISATGCKMAYCLDGGQTAAIVMNDQLINRPVYGEQRKISDIIYFATAVPDGG